MSREDRDTHRPYQLARRLPDGTVRRGALREVLDDVPPRTPGAALEADETERWLCISPHDDDLAISAGLLLATAVSEGIEVTVRIVTDGRMGYTSVAGADEIVSVRRAETRTSFQALGITGEEWYGYPDAQLQHHQGRRVAGTGDPHVVAGYSGLQNSLVADLRAVRPHRVFVLAASDYHPDHKCVHEELLISLFHAGGDLWPEIGAPMTREPLVYELAAYCPFAVPPDLELRTDAATFEKKLNAIAAYASQAQIRRLVEGIRRNGPVEHYRRLPIEFYDPAMYTPLFD